MGYYSEHYSQNVKDVLAEIDKALCAVDPESVERFVDAAIRYDSDEPMTAVQEKLMSLISENYRAIYHVYAKGKDETERLYLRLLLVTDEICGMTDSYAKEMYQELGGIK